MDLPSFEGIANPGTTVALLWLMLAIALGFEFVNGFHDTANAVATVIYTRSLGPRTAVVWSGLCNFVGVHIGGTAVAFSIVHLLPVDLLIAIGSKAGMAMVLALLISAIVWNLGTWYLGLPASSSHTLIGAILGVGLAHSAIRGSLGSGVNWLKAGEVGLSLLISPVVGFVLAALMLWFLKAIARGTNLDRPPEGAEPPPPWVRAILLTTCTGVSLAHGSNDGQKGIGLIMLILIGILPAQYALNPAFSEVQARRGVAALDRIGILLGEHPEASDPALRDRLGRARAALADPSRLRAIGPDGRWGLRTDLLAIDGAINRLLRNDETRLNDKRRESLEQDRATLQSATDFAPTWVTIAVAAALGVGTMIGWKRIVVTVGEKIGKGHLTYAQGAAAELIAMLTIGLADLGGLPVSTTHVLSSGVAGTMAASRSGLQGRTVRNIALAWVLTLPATMALAAGLFGALRLVFR